MSKLLRIIAIDNISRNQIIYINADGHTNFNGENGSGKTSTLRASLLFFGARPGDIAKAKGDTFEGFATFYFPRESSYLVYEYERLGKKLCVICSALKGQVQYQFLNTAFDEAFFLYIKEDKTLIASTAQVRINTEHKGFELSRKMGPDVYASIIQSNKPFRKKTGSFELIRQLRPRYSFPTQGGSMNNVDRVLSNIFSSRASVAHIQSALTNILIEENLIPSRVLKLNEQTGTINDWFNARDAWQSLEARRDNVIALSEAASKHQSLHDQLSALHHHCKSLSITQSQALVSLENDITLNIESERLARESMRVLSEEISTEAIELKSQASQLERQITDLLNIKADFEKGTDKIQPISALKDLHGNLQWLEKQEIDAKNLYSNVSDGVKDIVALYEAEQAKVTASISELKNANQKLISAEQALLHKAMSNCSDLFKQKSAGALSLRDQRRESLSSQIKELEKQRTRFEVRLEDVSFSLDYRDSILELETTISTAEKEFSESFDDNLAASQILTNICEERKKVSEQLIILKTNRQVFVDEQSDIRSRIEQGTLFDFLQENVRGFEENIGKVIKPELLALKGLSPSFESPSSSFYGVTLNLDGIDKPPILKINDLHERIMSLDESIASIDSKINDTEIQLGKLKDSHTKADGDLARSNFEVKDAKNYLETERQNLKEEKIKAQADLQSRHEQDNKSLAQSCATLGELNVKDRTLISKYKEDISELSSQESIEIERLRALHQEAVANLNENLRKNLLVQAVAAKNIETNKSEDIANKGLSPERIEHARLAFDLAASKVREANNAGERVRRYEKFITGKWLEHHVYSIKLEKTKQETADFELSSSQKKGKQHNALESISAKSKSLDLELAKTNHDKRITIELIEEFVANGIEPDSSKSEHFRSADINQCKIRYNKLKADYDSYKARGTAEFNTLETTFCRTTGTAPRKFYEKMRTELLKHNRISELWWASAQILEEYIENEHVSQLDLLRSNYILVAKEINDFSELINSAHKSLNNLGRKLTATTKNVVDRFDAIGKIEVRISSKLKGLAYFAALESFSTAHDNWAIHSSSELPDDELISKLTNLIQVIGTNKLVINLDTSFSFEVILEDNGTLKTARTDDEIETLSSTGLSYLIITAIYIGLINLLRTDPDIHLLFCVDEIGKLSKNNTGKLISLFDEHNICIFSALPDASAELIQHYPYAYNILDIGANSRIYQLYGEESRITTHSKVTDLVSQMSTGAEA